LAQENHKLKKIGNKKIMRSLLFFIGLMALQINVLSQTVDVKSYVDKNTVAVNEIITFSISTNSNCQIYTPEFGGLTIIQGPFRSSSSRIVNINGQRSVEQELKYTYRLRAPKAGSYRIEAVNLVCNGKKYQTKGITIKATEGANSAGGIAQSVPANSSDFFMRMFSNKTTVYQGEPFTISLKIYSLNQPQNIENLELGDSKGLWRKDLNPNQSTFNSDVEILNGMRYFTTTIRTELCFAQNSGKIEIKPAYIAALFQRGFFNQYRKEANSNGLTINVKPLPNGAPKDFNGLVGKFDLKHNISRNVLKPGEAIDLKVEISGSGNLNTFDDPAFEFPNDFEQFDPEIENKLSHKNSGISGSIIYNYVLIPTFYGNYTIPAYSFSYFDLETKTYKTLSTGDIAIEVLKTANSEAGNTALTQNKKAIQVEETDIHHLLPYRNNQFGSDDFVIGKLWFYGLLLLPFGLAWFLLWRRAQRQSDNYILSTALKASFRESKELIKEAKAAAFAKENNQAIQAVNTAFKSFIKRKNNLTNLELNRNFIINRYTEMGWSEASLSTLKNVWDTIEMYQYAPISTSKLDHLITDTELLIDKIASEQ
jgi:hypothetical protein